MAELVLTIDYNNLSSGLVISPEDLVKNFFFGIPLVDKMGNQYPMSLIAQNIQAAQEEIEKYLNIKLLKQIITEDKDYFSSDFAAWGYMRATYPVVEPLSLDGYIGTIKQITYPKEWLSARKTSDGLLYHRHVYMVPNTNAPNTNNNVVFSGIMPFLGMMGNSQIPNYWTMSYVTGFCKQPQDILNIVGMLASINVLNVIGDSIVGVGVSSSSIGIDGLSQSISTTNSSGNSVFGARIKSYTEQIKNTLLRIENTYKGFTVQAF